MAAGATPFDSVNVGAPASSASSTPFDNIQTSAPQQTPDDAPWYAQAGHAISTAASDLGGMVKGAAQSFQDTVAHTGRGHGYSNAVAGSDNMQAQMEQGNADDARRKAAGYSPAYRVVAPIAQAVGVNVNGMEDAASKGDTAGVVGHTIAPVAALAAGEAVNHGVGPSGKGVARVAGNIKDSLHVTPELKATAAHVGDAPVASATDIHAQAASKVQTQLAPALDDVAKQAGVDTSNVHSLSEKAEVAGRAYRKSAQTIYTQLDQAAEKATGQPGKFQDLTGNIRTLEQEVRDPMLKTSERADVQARLDNANKQYNAFKQQMVDAGLDEKVIKQADKAWAQGAALDEVSRGFLTNEDANGNVKPSARPLDAPVKKFTAPASPRGHILKQALGDHAPTVQSATVQAAQETMAAKTAAKATREANTATNQAAAKAQGRIKEIHRNQIGVAKGAAGALGLGYAATKGKAVYDALAH